MDFLRRLHPGHADSPAAARLERAPRWATAGRQAATAPPSPHPAGDEMRASHADPGTAAQAMLQPTVTPLESTRAATVARVSAAPPSLHELPLPTPDARAAEDGAGRAGAGTAQPVAAVQAAIDASRPPAREQTRPAGDTAVAAQQPMPIAAVRPAPRAAAPLRSQTLQQAQRTAKPDAAPVVQVTIDRIDVRVAAPPHASAPARKPRPASTVAPLANYLRSKTNAGAAR